MGSGKGFGLLFEMGTGKSLTAIAVMGAGYQRGCVRRALIVAPTSVVSVWPSEFEQYADFPYRLETLLGTKTKRLQGIHALTDAWHYQLQPALLSPMLVAVINYESVWREDIFDALKEFDPDIIICDESQRIKSNSSKQSKAMHKLGDLARYKMILTGTPVQNQAIDLYSQYRFLDPSVFGTNFFAFKNHYCIMGGFNGHQIIGYRDTDNLVKKEHSIAFRVTKAEALDLPEQTFETRYVPLTSGERRLYNEIKRDSYAELENGGSVTAATVLTKLLRLQQFTGGFLLEDGEEKPKQVGTGKLDALKDILEDYVIHEGKKLVVFARFLAEIHAIEDLCNKVLGAGHAVSIYGDIKKELRGGIIHRFQTDPETMVFIGQIDTAGAGITLTAADTCVYYSLCFNYASYEQSLARIHRIGQKNTCTYIHLVAEKTIDADILKALDKKAGLATRIVDDWRKFFTEET